jgi:hypothetical protein
MRTPIAALLLSSTLCANTATAQVDIGSLMQQGGANALGGVTIVEDTDPFVPNQFIGSFRMEVRTYENGEEAKDSPMSVVFHSKADMTVMHPQGVGKGKEDMRILTDLKGKWQYTLMTDKKGERTAMKMRKMKIVVSGTDEGADDANTAKVRRTDETRTIEGQLCRKYEGSDEDGTWTAWIAEDLPTPFAEMSRNMLGDNGGFFDLGRDDIKGMPMETEHVSHNGGERNVSRITDLVLGKVDESAFSLDGYQVMEMPRMPGMPMMDR